MKYIIRIFKMGGDIMNKKILMLLLAAIVSGVSFMGCGSRGESAEQEISADEVERLPEDQKNIELDKMLAERRKMAKDLGKIENGNEMGVSASSVGFPGQTENMPELLSREEFDKMYTVAIAYIAEKLGIDKNDNEGLKKINFNICIDPRANAIYDDEDKGVADGYANEDILIVEYEETEDVYNYLFLGRDLTSGEWKALHDGLTYKV